MTTLRAADPTHLGLVLAQLAACHAPPGHFDELRGALATPCPAPTDAHELASLSPHWSAFFATLGSENGADMAQRLASLARQVHDNGITYNVYADRNGPQRPWSLDLFPLLIDAASWQQIEAGVSQRMRLLERLMADVYGPQQLVRQGVLPAALVHGHPGYLRAVHGVQPVGGRFLHLAAFDLARQPDGRWWLIGQRTQAPSGLGYLLENRLAIKAQFPLAFQTLRVQRLASTYRALMDSLHRMSPEGQDAHLALLTPGPYNETYFEHAYLARYLGLTLVEAGDLLVRDERLYLKTLRGLVPVHGLLKRVDDDYLDPLELRPDSTLGVPGLLQAIRAGHVLMANAAGSALLESPALQGFLPALSRHLLQEELRLPALTTRWCGEPGALAQALPMLASDSLLATYPTAADHDGVTVPDGASLDASTIEAWSQRIRARPEAYTLQQQARLSQMPAWQMPSDQPQAGRMVARSVVLRVYAVSDGDQSWRVLPGGLARVAGSDSQVISMQRGGSSADVWVLADGEPDHPGVHPPHLSAESLMQRKRLVTSRAAENLFWLGRYTERCENLLRLARLTLESLHAEEVSSQPLLHWLGRLAFANALVAPGMPGPEVSVSAFERSLIDSLNSTRGATSVGFCLRALKLAASHLRERLSQQHWRLITRAEEELGQQLSVAGSCPDVSAPQALQILKDTGDHMAAISGAQTDRMMRDDGWRLLTIGRMLERLIFLSHALDAALSCGSLDTDSGFDAMIELADSTLTFHAQYQQSRDIAALVKLLVLDGDNPRSVAWVAHTLRKRLARLAGDEPVASCALALRIPDPSLWHLGALCPSAQASAQAAGAPADDNLLRRLMQHCGRAANELSNEIGSTYFSHSVMLDHSLGTA